MTDDQRERLRRLAGCTMLPGSAEKRFVRTMAATPEPVELSPKQAAWVETIWHRYRRQLGRPV